MPRALLCLVLAALALGAAGCGDDGGGTLRERAERLEQRLKAERDRIRERIEEFIGQIEQAIPEARETNPQVRSQGSTDREEIDAFMLRVLENVDAYWTETLKASGIQEPRGSASLDPARASAAAPAGRPATTPRSTARPTTRSTSRSSSPPTSGSGVSRGLPGQRAGFGRAAGDFGVAYVLAHEYAHNLQHEFGLFTLRPSASAEPFELQADCLAGAWGNSVYREGLLEPGDVEEAINTALAVGDFDVNNAQHHGRPEERREAWLLGFEGGDPSACGRYVPSA